MTVWFTSDTHFGHTNIIEYCNRPFSSIYDMDESLLYEINKVVKPTDMLYHLGDFSFRNISHYLDRINCKNINLIYGNHDKSHRKELSNILPCFDLKRIKVCDQDVILCHYAMAIWEKSHHGSIHLYGHSHSNAEENLDKIMPERLSMDVGVDNAFKLLGTYRPFSFEEIQKILNSKKGFSHE